MTTFLFWNLNARPLQEIVARLAQHHNVDVIMLAECAIQPTILLKTLNLRDDVLYHYIPQIGCTKIEIYTRFPPDFLVPKYDTDRITIRHLRLPETLDILLAVAHLPSKLYWRDSSQNYECVELSDAIRTAEASVGHSRTVLVGDLNVHPFDEGVVSSRGLHAAMSRKITQQGSRVVQGREYPFLYNPMWSLLGDHSPGPPGTYYYSGSEHVAFFWHMFDQVLLRPELLDRFSNSDLKILDRDGKTTLLSQSAGIPDKSVGSDHLPLLFELQL